MSYAIAVVTLMVGYVIGRLTKFSKNLRAVRQLKHAREQMRELSPTTWLPWSRLRDGSSYSPRHAQANWLRMKVDEQQERLRLWWLSTEPRDWTKRTKVTTRERAMPQLR